MFLDLAQAFFQAFFATRAEGPPDARAAKQTKPTWTPFRPLFNRPRTLLLPCKAYDGVPVKFAQGPAAVALARLTFNLAAAADAGGVRCRWLWGSAPLLWLGVGGGGSASVLPPTTPPVP